MNAECETDDEQISLLKTVNELHRKNKLTKVNAWKYDYIDSFQSLIRNHHRYTSNFQNVCPSMDTMAKIYELRVDSVSTDILRIAHRVPNAPHESFNELNETDQPNVDVHEEGPMKKNNRGKRQKRRLNNNNFRANIGTKAQLNGPLQMLSSIPDPIISKKQKMDSDEQNTNCMLLNLYPTNGQSNVSICVNQRFFDTSRAERIELEENNDYDVPTNIFFELPIKIYREYMLIRPALSCYALKETLDDDEYCESIAPSVADQSDNFIFDFDGMEQDEYYYGATQDTNSPFESNDHVNELNHENEADAAAMHDENLESPNDIQPSHPPFEDLSKGDYSYFKSIENYSLGPSFWRFKNARKRSHPNNSNNNNKPAPKPAKSRRKKIHEMPSFTTSDDSSDDDFNGPQKVREVNYARWDKQKNLLPMYRTNGIEPIPKDFFDFYEFAPRLRTWTDAARGNNSLNYLNSPLNSSDDECQNFDIVPPFANSPDTSRFNEMPAFDNNNNDMEDQMHVETPEWERQGDISQLYTGAPPEIEQININFNKLPKQINMKRVNTATFTSIKKQFERSIELSVNVRYDEKFEKGYATFANTHGSLVKRFTDIASPSITLLSILHNTNDHRLNLDRKPNENSNNFKIQQLKKSQSRPSFDSNELIVDVEHNG